jgi:CrcB protein
MRELLLVGAGGFLGAALRYGVSQSLAPWSVKFPWHTLSINVAGCLLIGLITPAVENKSWLLFLVPGILGGFTTFSAFGLETWKLAQQGTPVLAGAYVAASVVLGLAAVGAGRGIGQFLK